MKKLVMALIVVSLTLILVSMKLYNINREYKALTEEHQELIVEKHGLLKELGAIEVLTELLKDKYGNDYNYWLCLMDYDLKSVKNGKYALGSFTDCFVPNAGKALKAGAPEKLVKDRIESVVTMATQGLFLSSYEEQLMKYGGSDAIRAYAYNWLELK